jgi:hypothetical protein
VDLVGDLRRKPEGPQLIPETGYTDRPRTGRAVTHRKRRVDECVRLDATIFRPFIRALPRYPWMRVSQTWESGGFGFVVLNHDTVWATPAGLAIAELTGAGFEEDLRDHGQLVPFTPTEPNLGGLRWWFRCPIPRPDTHLCSRRVRVLYKPLGERLFACRHCHDLSYKSRQRHRHRFYEGFERPFAAYERLAADMRSRSPRRRLRALSIDPFQVSRAMEAFGAPRGSGTNATCERMPRPVPLTRLRHDPLAALWILEQLDARAMGTGDVGD